jgi:hypothetical protein
MSISFRLGGALVVGRVKLDRFFSLSQGRGAAREAGRTQESYHAIFPIFSVVQSNISRDVTKYCALLLGLIERVRLPGKFL